MPYEITPLKLKTEILHPMRNQLGCSTKKVQAFELTPLDVGINPYTPFREHHIAHTIPTNYYAGMMFHVKHSVTRQLIKEKRKGEENYEKRHGNKNSIRNKGNSKAD